MKGIGNNEKNNENRIGSMLRLRLRFDKIGVASASEPAPSPNESWKDMHERKILQLFRISNNYFGTHIIHHNYNTTPNDCFTA